MKLNPKRAAVDVVAPEDETFKILKRAPYSEACEVFYSQFGFNPITSEEVDKRLNELGWTWDDFHLEFIGKSPRSFTDGDVTFVTTVTQLTSS